MSQAGTAAHHSTGAARLQFGSRTAAFWHQHGFVRLLLRRAVAMLFLSFGVTLVAFVLTHVIPADPAAANLGIRGLGDPLVVQAYRSEYGLDRPLPVQYQIYISHLIHGDFGLSQLTRRPVAADLRQFVPASFELGILAIFVAIVIGVPLGLLASTRKDSTIDQVLSLVSLGGISTPLFWIGLVGLYVFSFVFQIAPGGGRLSPGVIPPPQVTGMYTVDSLIIGDFSTFGDALHHLILPALVLAVGGVGVLLRFTRAAVLEVIHNDFVIAARAKGLPGSVVLLRYTLRAALTPILTLSGLMFADLITGAVLVESVFAFPGVGLYAARSALDVDLPAITGVCIFVAIVYTLTNLMVDLLQSLIDPRVRVA